jgi:NAD(P)-dependent dehydrogenase (short-subunit alcohol dehydrogenase family)
MALDRRFVVNIRSSSDERVVISIDEAERKAVSIDVRFRAQPAPSFKLPTLIFSREPLERSFEEAAAASGSLQLAIDDDLGALLFPALHSWLPGVQLAELLATTRLVGMVCPGRFSIFGGLHLRARHSYRAERTIEWSVTHSRAPYSLLTIGIDGPTFTGTLDTFYRPPPRASLSYSSIAARVGTGAHASWRALVIGGSRGLGEAIAKAVAAGGGDVCITWNRGETEARAIVNDIVASGGRATAMHLDVTDVRSFVLPFAPTHVFYLATPFIRIEKGRGFDHELFESLTRCYVHGLDRIARAVHRIVGGGFFLFAPSTALLSTRDQGSSAYCAAKAAMEEVLAHLGRELKLTVSAPRLGRVATDQTSTLMHTPATDPLDVAIEILRAG